MRRRFSRLEAFDFPLLVVASLAFFALVVWSVLREGETEWGPIQRRFVGTLERFGEVEAARSFTPGIKQIWIPQLGRVDRCVSCHLGYEWGSVLPTSVPAPLAPHPDLSFMQSHPFPEFGCTVCHGGQGFATEKRAAHGEVGDWDEPLLSGPAATRNGLTAAELIQLRCNGCHRRDEATTGLETIARARVLFKKRKCIVCHVVEGRGGLVAPELTYIGDKDPELFDFSHVSGPHTVFNWHVEHLTNAGAVTPGTTMPTFSFSPEDAQALTLLLLSWRRQTFPPNYLPGPRSESATGEAPQPVREVPVPPVIAGVEAGREVFVAKGCNTCHAVGGGTVIGPDLQGVASRRDAEWLRAWLADPAAMIRSHPDLASWPAAYGNIIMPNQNLSSREIDALIAYLGKV
jgi:cytochrome c2